MSAVSFLSSLFSSQRLRCLTLLVFFFTAPALHSFKVAPLLGIGFQISSPLYFVSVDDLAGSGFSTSYADKHLRKVAFPFYFNLYLGFIFNFDAMNDLVALWKVNYSDDPINALLDEKNFSTKLTPFSFGDQSLNHLVLVQHILTPLSFLQYTTTISAIFSFSRASLLENFAKSIDNYQSYGLMPALKLFNLGTLVKELRGAAFYLSAFYGYNYFPNGDFNPSFGDELPATKKDFHNSTVNLKLDYAITSKLPLSLAYKRSMDFYVKNKVRRADLNNPGYQQENETISRDIVTFNFTAKLIDRLNYELLGFNWGYEFTHYDGNYVEQLIYDDNQRGDARFASVPLPQLGKNVSYLQDFKDYLSHVASFFAEVNLDRFHSLNTSYAYTFKSFKNQYARYGSKSSSGFGAYKNEKRADQSHVLSLGYVYKNNDASKKISPYFGMKFSRSNDRAASLNYDLYFLGIKTDYEF